MYKIFIVEDEPLIRDNLRKMILRIEQNLSIQFCGEANDGEMALSMMQDLKPDILLTDIRMPFMSGLDLSKHAKQLMPWLKIIIISGFDDFDYARQAIAIGVNRYLLKPVVEKELQDDLKKIIKNIEEQKQEEKSVGTERKLLKEISKEQVLNLLFHGKMTVEFAINQQKNLNYSFISQKFRVILCKIFCSDLVDTYKILTNRLFDLFESDSAILSSFIPSEYIKLLISDKDEQNLIEKTYQVANVLQHEISANSKNSAQISIGSTATRISEIQNSYNACRHLFELKKTETILSYDEEQINTAANQHPTIMNESLFEDKLLSLGEKDIPVLLGEIANLQNENEAENSLVRYHTLNELITFLKKSTYGKTYVEQQNYENLDYLFTISQDQSLFEEVLEKSLAEILNSQSFNKKGSHLSQPLSKAIEYMKENYKNPDISLNSVAKHVSLSPTHFSTIFSQNIGVTFIDYLTELRMKEAKKILFTTKEKLAVITYQVGYNDPNYFSYLFKKRNGLSPTEFRHQEQQKN